MNANPNDARFFMTLCNYLKKSNVEFETTDKREFDYNGKTYNITSEQFGIVEHSKENLMTAFEQILALLTGDFEKIYLYKFFFDVIDETTGIGQYTLQYCLVDKEIMNDFSEPEPVWEPEQTTESEQAEPQNSVEDTAYDEEDSYADETQSFEEPVLDQEEIIVEENQSEPEEDSFTEPEPISIQKTPEPKINPVRYETPPIVQTQGLEGLENDIDYLLKLLVRNIHPEVSDVVSRAILIVIKNRLNIPF